MLLNSFSLTSPAPQLLSIKARSVSRPTPIKSRPAKPRETLLINFYKWCNASFSFSNSECGCYFLWKKGKKHEEQICNSTEQFIILKTLTAITCSKALHQSRDLGEKNHRQLHTLSLDKWATITTRAAHILRTNLEVSSSKNAPQLLLGQADMSMYFEHSRTKSVITSLSDATNPQTILNGL